MSQLTGQGQTLDILFVNDLHRIEDNQRGQEHRKAEDACVMILRLIKRTKTFAVNKNEIHIAFPNVDRLTPEPNALGATLCLR